MRTFFGTPPAGRRRWPRWERRALTAGSRWRRSWPTPPRAHPGSEEGFLLIEVVISAFLVGLIVVATLTGFDVVNRVSADQRQRNQAAALAAESQEQLRSDPASQLQLLKATPHAYTHTIAGTTFKIVQTGELRPASGSNAACSVTESKRQSGNAFSIVSTVSWPQQERGNKPKVTASSIITPPTGSALEVDADNAHAATAGVSGVTAVVTYTPSESQTPATLEQTTGSEGCVVFGGIPSTSAIVEIPETAGYVTISGSSEYPTEEVTLAPNYTTHHAVYYNKGGAIKAQFTYNSKTTYKHKNNESTGEVEELVIGDTFVALNTKMESAPNFEVGSTRYGAAIKPYEPLPGAPGTYEATATSKSNLFPFLESEGSWAVYAGDCTENNAEAISGGSVKLPSKVVVKPGETTTAQVPMSYVTLNLYKGTQAEVKAPTYSFLETQFPHPATITNTKCTGVTPDNEKAISNKHTQETTIGTLNGGHLAAPFQPFGKEYELCVAANGKTFSAPRFENKEAKGSSVSIYLGQKSVQEKASLKSTEEAAEAAVEANRLTTEKGAKTTREATEAAAKTKAEATEATERKTWETEEKAKPQKVTPKQKTEKLNTQAAIKKTRETNEATAKKKAEETEATARKSAEAGEAATETARKSKETTEATEAATTKITVETQSSCP